LYPVTPLEELAPHERSTAWAVVVGEPSPVTGIVKVPALLAIVMVPEATPPPFGENSETSTALWPAAIVVPALTPVTLNPVPLRVTELIVTLAFPVLFRVTSALAVPPTVTLPKERLAGLVDSERVVAVPAPESKTVSNLFVAFDVIPREPL
jgi:hypothetical protein